MPRLLPLPAPLCRLKPAKAEPSLPPTPGAASPEDVTLSLPGALGAEGEAPAAEPSAFKWDPVVKKTKLKVLEEGEDAEEDTFRFIQPDELIDGWDPVSKNKEIAGCPCSCAPAPAPARP